MNTPVKWFETSLLAISAFNLFVVFFTLLWHIRRIQPASILLLVWLFIAGVAMAMMFAINTGLIVYAPWLYLLPSPLYYLIFPAGYLYIRMMLNDQVRLTRWDALHALPAGLHFVELLPYYLMPLSFKLEVVLSATGSPLGVFTHGEGLLSDFHHNILRGAIGLGYGFAIFRLFRYSGYEKSSFLSTFPVMVRWLKAFGFMQFIIAISLFMMLGIPSLAPPHIRVTMLYMLLALSQTGTALIFIFNPGLMYGIPKFAGRQAIPSPLLHRNAEKGLSQPTQDVFNDETEIDTVSRNGAHQQQLLGQIEYFIDTEKPYLKHRYNTTDLSSDLGIPAHHISYILNHVLKIKYSDYINQKRLDHMQNLVETGELSHYTLESIALKSGFNSRVTFIRSVQKLKGMNPSEYFKS